ncbi:hypothetical protein BGX30_004676, partial [Mortierella sp. GBA39]
SLKYVLESNRIGKLTEDEARGIFAQVAKVLAYMHSKDMVHGRLQPSNVLLREDDAIMLNDFGPTKQCSRDMGLCDSWGTLAYMPPERRTPPRRYGKAADAWASGVLVYRTLIGKKPTFEKTTHYVVLGKEIDTLSKEFQNLLRALLSPDPKKKEKKKAAKAAAAAPGNPSATWSTTEELINLLVIPPDQAEPSASAANHA